MFLLIEEAGCPPQTGGGSSSLAAWGGTSWPDRRRPSHHLVLPASCLFQGWLQVVPACLRWVWWTRCWRRPQHRWPLRWKRERRMRSDSRKCSRTEPWSRSVSRSTWASAAAVPGTWWWGSCSASRRYGLNPVQEEGSSPPVRAR